MFQNCFSFDVAWTGAVAGFAQKNPGTAEPTETHQYHGQRWQSSPFMGMGARMPVDRALNTSSARPQSYRFAGFADPGIGGITP